MSDRRGSLPYFALASVLLLAGCPAEKATPVTCPTGQTNCLGACTDTSVDAANCGGCGQGCGLGTCSGGSCSCTGSAIDCGGWPACVDLATDEAHCGACNDAACRPGEECNGTCACLPGYTDCPAAGGCFNLANDPRHCGACDVACATGATCSGATPTCACPAPTPDLCNDACVDALTDASACGRGGVCAVCPTGGDCTDGHCGCPDAAPTICGSGPGACTDLFTDEAHCGSCATSCTTGKVCTLGTCCAPGQLACGSTTRSCCNGGGCCGDACQTQHSNGLGQSYFDCSPLDTYSAGEAVLAADAWSAGADVNMALTACPTNCFGRRNADGSRCAIWCYAGSQAPGHVFEDGLCICPTELNTAWH